MTIFICDTARWLTRNSLSRRDAEDILDLLTLQDEDDSDWTSSNEEDLEFLYMQLAFPERDRVRRFDLQECSELHFVRLFR